MPGVLPTPLDCCSSPCGDSICVPTPLDDAIDGRLSVAGLINVTSAPYRAVADGTTDNTTALQAALQAASTSGLTLYFPAGIYRTRQLKVYANTRITGAGRELTTLRFIDPTNTVGMRNADETTPMRNLFIENIGFQVLATGTAVTVLLRFKNIGYSSVRNCRFDLTSEALTTRTAFDLDGGGGNIVNTYFNTIANNQFVHCYSGITFRDAANANRVVENNVFLSGFYGVTIDESVQNTVENNSFQDMTGGIGVNLTGTTANAFNTIRANFFELLDYGIYVAGTVQLTTIGPGNNYSGIGLRTYHIASPNPQTVLEADFSSFQDVGQFAQPMQLRESPLGIAPPAADAAYARALFTVPRSSTNPSAAFIQLQRADSTYEMVPFALAPNFVNFADGDTTPSVRYLKFARTVNSAPTTITNFDDEFYGQDLFILVRDNNTTFNFTSVGSLRGNSGQSYLASDGDIILARTDDNGVWWCLIYSATQGFSTQAAFGLEIVGKTGSNYDTSVMKPDKSAAVMAVPTGTQNVDVFGTLSVQGFGNQRIYACTGTPEGQVSASIGSICLRSDGGVGTSFYVKESNSGGPTGWGPK